nr:diphthine--ammonia ligase [Dehalococcoides mccartyi]
MNKVFVSWSGGKDSCLSYYKALENGLEVSCLVNITNQDGKYSCTHGLPTSFLQAQAHSIGVPIIQLRTNGEKYESDLKKLCCDFREQGISGAVFGNGDVEHSWIGRVCQEVNVTPYFPLDDLNKDEIIKQLVDLGFEAITVTVRADVFGKQWLGRKIDRGFLEQINSLSDVMNLSPNKKAGIYHTTIIDGPIFKNRMEIIKSEALLKDGYWFLQIMETVEIPSISNSTSVNQCL